MLVRPIAFHSSTSPWSNPRGPPKPALAKATSTRPNAPRARSTSACWSAHSVTSHATATARLSAPPPGGAPGAGAGASPPAELLGGRLELALGGGGEDEPVARLGGV